MPIIANTYLISDSSRFARYLLTANATTTVDESDIIKIVPSTLIGALNATGHILAGNANPLPQYNVYITRITWSVTTGGTNPNAPSHVDLKWQQGGGAGNIILMGLDTSGSIDIGRGRNLEMAPLGNSGNIITSTEGFVAGSTYSIMIDLRKDFKHFDQGQWKDPVAFNFDPRRPKNPLSD